MLKLKLYFGHLMWRTDSFEKTLMWERLKWEERAYRGWNGWMASPTQLTRVWVISGSLWWTGKPVILQSTGLQSVEHDWATDLNWTDIHCLSRTCCYEWDLVGDTQFNTGFLNKYVSQRMFLNVHVCWEGREGQGRSWQFQPTVCQRAACSYRIIPSS